jgi:branched-chain amino acid transport system substrate-binding protein
VLYQNDDYGRAYLDGLKKGLGDRAAKMIVMQAAYESTDPTVDSQIVSLQASGADVLLTAAIPRMVAQTIRKVYEIGWKPLHLVQFGGASTDPALRFCFQDVFGIGPRLVYVARASTCSCSTSLRTCSTIFGGL